MAGHSKFKNIMHRKGAQDKKRGKVFTKIIRELTVAAKINPDPESNPRLRSAITTARGANMPKDTMERAIKKAAGGDDGTNYEEVRYEGYGPGGVAIVVDALTDNRNRTASDVRSTFTKYGGNLGESNSVAFMFVRIGLIEYPVDAASPDEMFEAALEAGATNVETSEDKHEIQTEMEDLNSVRDALIATYGEPETARLSWNPTTTSTINQSQAETLFKLIDVLEDNDDVQYVTANFDVPDDVMDKISL